MKPAKIIKTAIRALFSVSCALFLWVVYFSRSGRSPCLRRAANDMEHRPVRHLPRVRHRDFGLVINTLIT